MEDTIMPITVDYSDRAFKTMARTLYPGNLGFHEDSGWTISGKVWEDYYEWISEFEAVHPVYGKIKGNFEIEVSADSTEALDHFLKYHPFNVWDYYDI